MFGLRKRFEVFGVGLRRRGLVCGKVLERKLAPF